MNTYGSSVFTRTTTTHPKPLAPYFNYQYFNNKKFLAVPYASVAYKLEINDKLFFNNKFKHCLSVSASSSSRINNGKNNINGQNFSWSQNKGSIFSYSIIKSKFILTHKTKNDYIC